MAEVTATPLIAVVDDDPEIVRLLRSYLQRSGYQVSVAANGESALVLGAAANRTFSFSISCCPIAMAGN